MSGQFRVVADVAAEPDAAPIPQAQQQARQATQLLLTALAALSQRAVVAIASLFSLALAGSVFWLALAVAQQPSDRQIGVLGLYAAFVLALHWIKRRG